jgi:hypothetical protein
MRLAFFWCVISAGLILLGGTSAHALCNWRTGGACVTAYKSRGWNSDCTERCEIGYRHGKRYVRIIHRKR